MESVGICLFVFIMTVILIFAVLSNGLVIYCVVKIKSLRTITNVFLCNLSVSDILLAGFILPQRLHDITHKENFFEGTLLCKMVNFFPLFVISASIYTLVCISFERNRVILDSHAPRMTNLKLTILIVFIWIFSLAISIPTLLEYSVGVRYQTTGNETETYYHCASHATTDQSLANALFVIIISYVIPVVLMTKNYLQVAKFLWKRGRRIKNNTDISTQHLGSFQLMAKRVKLVKLLVLVAVIFALSWLPFFVTLFFAMETGKDASEYAAGFVNLLLIALATFSSAYNVVLYHMFDTRFKKAIKETLSCSRCKCKKHNSIHVVDIRQVTEKNERNKKSTGKGEDMVVKTTDENGRVFIIQST